MARELTRRGLVRLLGVGAAAAALGHGTVGRARATDGNWRQHRHDARNSGNASGHDVPTGGLVEDWRREIDENRSPPTVADDTVYVSDSEGVHAVDAADGSQQWTAPVGAVLGSAPVVDGVVFAGTGSGHLHALDADEGEELWQESVSEDQLAYAPTVTNDTVYVGGDGLHARSPEDGSERWTFETRGVVSGSPGVADGIVYVGDAAGQVYAVNAADGSEEWTAKLPDGIVGSPAVVGGTVYFGVRDQGDIYALSAADGSLEWRVPTGEFATAPAVADGTVYVKGSRHCLALSATDGSERWRVEVQGEGWSSPLVADDTVYVGGAGRVYAIAADTGEVTDWFPGGAMNFRSPVAVGGTVYVITYRGTLFALTGGIKPAITGPSDIGWGETVTFSAEESVSPAESIESYEWTFDGITRSRATGARAEHAFWGPGPYDIELEVTDAAGRTARTTQTVSVQNGALLTGVAGILGVTGAGAAGVAGIRRLGGGGDDEGDIDGGSHAVADAGSGADAAGEAGGGSADDDIETTGDADAATGADETPEEYLEAAEAAVETAEDHRARGNYDDAVAAYDEAVRQYRAAMNRLPDDRREEVRPARERVEETRAALEEQRETRAALTEALRTAESHFQTAVAAPTSEKLVIPRERYRQANEAYQRALDLYDELDDAPETMAVSPTVDIATPPDELAQFPGMTPSALETIEDLGVETLPALRGADADAIDELRSADAVPERLEARLVGLHHWAGDDEVVLDGREALERRAALAKKGYHAHR